MSFENPVALAADPIDWSYHSSFGSHLQQFRTPEKPMGHDSKGLKDKMDVIEMKQKYGISSNPIQDFIDKIKRNDNSHGLKVESLLNLANNLDIFCANASNSLVDEDILYKNEGRNEIAIQFASPYFILSERDMRPLKFVSLNAQRCLAKYIGSFDNDTIGKAIPKLLDRFISNQERLLVLDGSLSLLNSRFKDDFYKKDAFTFENKNLKKEFNQRISTMGHEILLSIIIEEFPVTTSYVLDDYLKSNKDKLTSPAIGNSLLWTCMQLEKIINVRLKDFRSTRLQNDKNDLHHSLDGDKSNKPNELGDKIEVDTMNAIMEQFERLGLNSSTSLDNSSWTLKNKNENIHNLKNHGSLNESKLLETSLLIESLLQCPLLYKHFKFVFQNPNISISMQRNTLTYIDLVISSHSTALKLSSKRVMDYLILKDIFILNHDDKIEFFNVTFSKWLPADIRRFERLSNKIENNVISGLDADGFKLLLNNKEIHTLIKALSNTVSPENLISSETAKINRKILDKYSTGFTSSNDVSNMGTSGNLSPNYENIKGNNNENILSSSQQQRLILASKLATVWADIYLDNLIESKELVECLLQEHEVQSKNWKKLCDSQLREILYHLLDRGEQYAIDRYRARHIRRSSRNSIFFKNIDHKIENNEDVDKENINFNEQKNIKQKTQVDDDDGFKESQYLMDLSNNNITSSSSEIDDNESSEEEEEEDLDHDLIEQQEHEIYTGLIKNHINNISNDKFKIKRMIKTEELNEFLQLARTLVNYIPDKSSILKISEIQFDKNGNWKSKTNNRINDKNKQTSLDNNNSNGDNNKVIKTKKSFIAIRVFKFIFKLIWNIFILAVFLYVSSILLWTFFPIEEQLKDELIVKYSNKFVNNIFEPSLLLVSNCWYKGLNIANESKNYLETQWKIVETQHNLNNNVIKNNDKNDDDQNYFTIINDKEESIDDSIEENGVKDGDKEKDDIELSIESMVFGNKDIEIEVLESNNRNNNDYMKYTVDNIDDRLIIDNKESKEENMINKEIQYDIKDDDSNDKNDDHIINNTDIKSKVMVNMMKNYTYKFSDTIVREFSYALQVLHNRAIKPIYIGFKHVFLKHLYPIYTYSKLIYIENKDYLLTYI